MPEQSQFQPEEPSHPLAPDTTDADLDVDELSTDDLEDASGGNGNCPCTNTNCSHV